MPDPHSVSIVDLRRRIERLEKATLLLARHVGAVGWNYELQQALDGIRDSAHTREG
jgi:hypothetical protein